MDGFNEPIKMLLALIIGGLIGLEREINEKKSIGNSKKPVAILGIRSFALIGGLGALAGVLFGQLLAMSLLISSAFFVLLIVFYILDSLSTKDFGLTTEIAVIYTYLLGFLFVINTIPVQLLLAVSVILLLLLSKKDQIKNVVDDIRRVEINAFISYAIIALVVLPFLPNTTYSLSDIPGLEGFARSLNLNISKIAEVGLFNPFKTWFIVALITGVDILGYILERTIGQKKGWVLASIAGGFISSTATTQTLAQQSKQLKQVNFLLAAALLANLVSFFQIAIIIGTINSGFLVKLLPTLLSIIVAGFAVTFYYSRSKENNATKQNSVGVKTHEIFNLVPALKFAGLFLLISVISKAALAFFGNSAFLVTTAIGAFVGLDAVMINTAELAGQRIDFKLAALAFILANAVNLYAKSFYSFVQGNREFAIKFTISVTIIVLSSLLGLLFV